MQSKLNPDVPSAHSFQSRTNVQVCPGLEVSDTKEKLPENPEELF
jgi:hypothetical protein